MPAAACSSSSPWQHTSISPPVGTEIFIIFKLPLCHGYSVGTVSFSWPFPGSTTSGTDSEGTVGSVKELAGISLELEGAGGIDEDDETTGAEEDEVTALELLAGAAEELDETGADDEEELKLLEELDELDEEEELDELAEDELEDATSDAGGSARSGTFVTVGRRSSVS